MALTAFRTNRGRTIIIDYSQSYDRDGNGDFIYEDKEQDLVHATGKVFNITIHAETKKGKLVDIDISLYEIKRILAEVEKIEAIKTIEKFEF